MIEKAIDPIGCFRHIPAVLIDTEMAMGLVSLHLFHIFIFQIGFQQFLIFKIVFANRFHHLTIHCNIIFYMRENIVELKYKDKQIYLVKTAHVSKNSIEDVRECIEECDPDSICIELDAQRYERLENPDFDDR